MNLKTKQKTKTKIIKITANNIQYNIGVNYLINLYLIKQVIFIYMYV